jgi:hypothetical protein
MSRYFDRMRSVLERHGGTVEKFIGDAIMAMFGIPSIHEDDALRAVRAATELGEERCASLPPSDDVSSGGQVKAPRCCFAAIPKSNLRPAGVSSSMLSMGSWS